jgi:hypothetical protein
LLTSLKTKFVSFFIQVADLKRVWSLHEVIQLIEMNNESSNEFKTLLLRCVISPQYMQHDEVCYLSLLQIIKSASPFSKPKQVVALLVNWLKQK